MAQLLWPRGAPLPGQAEPDARTLPTNFPVQLTNMGPGNNPQAFLVTFERVAIAVQWPPEHWAILLVPYLTGPAQSSYQNMDTLDAL